MNESFWDANGEVWRKAVRDQLIESRKVTGPAVVDEIVAQRPKRILDLGCGEGWLVSQFGSQNIDYTGIDFSEPLARAAREAHPTARFLSASYEALVSAEAPDLGNFDVAVFNFALFEEDLRPILRKVASLLRANGRVVIQTFHPCFVLSPYTDSWKEENFRDFPIPFSGTMPWFGRTLGSWIETFSDAGLRVVKIHEPLNVATGIPYSILFTLERLL